MPTSLASLALCAILASTPAARAQPATSRRPLPPAHTRTLAVQVALDRAGFSPGEIDGVAGPNLKRALAAFAATHGIAPDPADPRTAERLGAPLSQPLTKVVLTEADLAGPFVDVPKDIPAQASLETLAYESPLEMIAERFHASPRLLSRLNPNVRLAPGATLLVPAVEPFVPPVQSGKRPPFPDAAGRVVRVSEQAGGLEVRDATNRVVFFAPVTVGGVNDPLPVGEWKVTQVFDRPEFNYNPDLFWDADPAHAKAKIAPGPNNPVGLTWIGLDKEHYGIHGTPEPSRVGHVQSHGCIRLTNWDALRLAGLVSDGTRIVLER